MSHKEQTEQRILDFVNGKMSAEDRRKFEAEMNTNEALKEEVSFYQSIAKTTQKMEDDELRRLFSETDQELDGEGFFEKPPKARPHGIFHMRKALAVAASLAFILVSAWWYGNSNYSNQAIAHRHFDAGVVQKMVRSTEGSDNPLSPGLEALRASNFEDAVSFFQTIPDSSGVYLEARFYLAIAHYQSSDFKSAFNHSSEVSESASRFKQKARWLQLSSMLQLNETGANFQIILDKAVNDETDPFYQKKALELKEDMESIWKDLADRL